MPRALPPARLRSLDLLRGLALALLVLVAASEHQGAAFRALTPVPWHGWSPADLVGALLATVSGASLALAAPAWRRQRRGPWPRFLRRVATLLALGLALAGIDWLLRGGPAAGDPRLPGVLQRLAGVTLLVGPLVLLGRWRLLSAVSALLALVHCSLLLLFPVPGGAAGDLTPGNDAGAWLDRTLLGPDALAHPTHDPAGLATWLGMALTLGIGALAGEYLRRRPLGSPRAARLGVAAALLLVAGTSLGPVLPVNPTLWTPPFALVGAGWSLLLLALAYETTDVRGWRFLAAPWTVLGRNALLLGTSAAVLAGLLDHLRPGGPEGGDAWQWLHTAARVEDDRLASLLVGLGLLLFAWLALWPLHRLRAWLVA